MFLTAIIQNLPYMAIIVPVLLVIGLILCFAEAIIPGFGICGILGILMLVGGTVYFTLGINEFYWVIVLVLGLIIGLVLIFRVFVRSANKGKLGKTAIFDTKTNLPVDYDLSGMMSNAKYVDKFGTVVTPCKPAGRIKIGEDEIDVVAKCGFIDVGTIVKVVEVSDNDVIVDVVKE